MTRFEELAAALDQAQEAIGRQNGQIMRLRDRLSTIRYHFNVAATALERIGLELRRPDVE